TTNFGNGQSLQTTCVAPLTSAPGPLQPALQTCARRATATSSGRLQTKSRAQRGNWSGGSVCKSIAPATELTRRSPVLKLSRFAGVSETSDRDIKREPAGEIPSAARKLKWRKRVRVERTGDGANPPPAGFEDREDHRTPFASVLWMSTAANIENPRHVRSRRERPLSNYSEPIVTCSPAAGLSPPTASTNSLLPIRPLAKLVS